MDENGNGEKKFTYEELKQAVKEADKDARLEMKVDFIIQKLEDPETGCAACRTRTDDLEKRVDRIFYVGGTVLAAFTLFGKDLIAWIIAAAKGGAP